VKRKKYLYQIYLSLFLFIFLFFLKQLSLAISFDRAQQDYLYNLERYQKKHEEYIRFKGAYVKYGTLSTRDEAVASGKDFLKRRAELIRTYLIMLRSKMVETSPSNFLLQDKLLTDIDSMILFFDQYQNRVKPVQTVAEFNNLSKEFDDQFPTVKSIRYRVLAVLLLKKEYLLLEEAERLKSLTFSELESRGIYAQQVAIWKEKVIQKLEKSRSFYNSATGSLEKLDQQDFNKYQFNREWGNLNRSAKMFKTNLGEALVFLEELAGKLYNNNHD
jgi:hypothetical protein